MQNSSTFIAITKKTCNDEQTNRNPPVPLADADLKQLADDLKNTVDRDTTDFATRNVTAAQLAAYDALVAAFDNTTTDIELQGAVSAVEIKNAL